MKRTAKLMSVMLVLACLLACLPVLNAAAAVPTTAIVTTSKSSYDVGEDVIFNITANGAVTHLWVYRVDGQWQETYLSVGATHSLAFGWAGDYKALVQTWNGADNLISEYCYFTVGSAASSSKPTSATIGTDKKVYPLGGVVNFSMNGDGETNTLWIYTPSNPSGIYFQNAGSSYAYIPTEVGQYEALMETWNGVGSFMSERISFRVVDPNAPVTTPPTTKPPVTEPPTNPPTNPPTEPPTVAPTDPPTVAPTDPPTTVKPQGGNQNPCAGGHKYKNGYCIYCAKKDPNWYPCINGHTYCAEGYCIYCLAEDPTYDPCANGHVYKDYVCIYCLAVDPTACDNGVHDYQNGCCTRCFLQDPNAVNPCVNGHDLDETGSCKNCNYYDPDFDPNNATTPSAPADKNTGKNNGKNNGDNNFWLWFWIILILFLIFVALAVVLIVTKNKGSKAPDDTTPTE